MDKYKEFETWAIKHGWFFVKQLDNYYWWLSPAGLCFYIKLKGEEISILNTCIELQESK